MIQHPVESIGLPAPPRCNGWELEPFACDVARKAGKKRHDRGRLNHAAAQRIGDSHISGDDGANEAGYAEERVAAQLKRIAEAIVDAAQNDIDLVEPVNGLEKHAAGREP